MSANRPKSKISPVGLVVVPLAILSVVFAAITMVVIASDRIAFASPGALLVAGLVLYAATIFLIGRFSFASVREFEETYTTDSLTKLPNRRSLRLDIDELNNDEAEVAIAVIDLDSFKHVNDHYDHAVGDQLIKNCAAMLQSICEPEARCYRLGGDEFAAVMTGPVAGTILEGMCRSMLEKLSKPVAVADRRIAVGASVGLAQTKKGEQIDSTEMLRRSDVAMYMSKRGGKMRCTWFSENFDERREAMRELDTDLRAALAHGNFELVYQPLVDAETGVILSAESLLRWTRPSGEVVPPSTFIPVAEESGLINAIGNWVLRTATRDAMEWGDIRLSVNISAAQLRNPEFPIQLGQILEETGYPPEKLELEITETCLVLDPDVAERSLDVIRSFGVNISLDDFGTGYASIGFLRQFRFEKLKLDRSLVIQAGEDESSRAMMLSTIAVARALDMQVTAEGVETQAQADLVRAAGCDQIQGWLYYKAMPSHELVSLLDSHFDAQQHELHTATLAKDRQKA